MSKYNEEKLTQTQFILGVLQQGLQFSFVEVIFLTMFILGRTTGDGIISPVILWTALIVSTLWVIITCSQESLADAKMYVLDHNIFISDFMISAALLTVGAVVVWPYPWYFSTMLLIAAVQNLRYTYLSVNWLLEDQREQRRKNRNGNLP